MAQYFSISPTRPQRRLIVRAAQIVRDGGVIAYPTDSCYAFGCRIGDREAVERLRRLRGFGPRRLLTLVCRDLSELATYARVDNARYRLIKSLTPGPYVFILRATREVPRRLLHPQRKTIGLRVPDHPAAQALLAELGEPMLSTTAILPKDDQPLNDGREIRARLERDLDLVLDAGSCGLEPSTVLDLTEEPARVLRLGKGRIAIAGL